MCKVGKWALIKSTSYCAAAEFESPQDAVFHLALFVPVSEQYAHHQGVIIKGILIAFVLAEAALRMFK